MKRVTIMSGPPASGKSHQARRLASELHALGEEGFTVSADHYHCAPFYKNRHDYVGIPFRRAMDPDTLAAQEDYEFKPENISAAHQTCMQAFAYNVTGGMPHIIVDNTNINTYEIAPYYLLGEAFGYEVEILRVETSLEVCLSRNTHKVPDGIVASMHRTFNTFVYERPKQHLAWW